MSTRRPKVPRTVPPAGGVKAGQPHRADAHAPQAPGSSLKSPLHGSVTTGLHNTPSSHRRGSARQNLPAGSSAARAAVRSELAGEIRRGTAATPAKPAGDQEQAELRPVPAKAFSGRLLVLAMVMIAITILLAPSVRTYVQQQAEIATLEAEIASAQQTQVELEDQLGRWEDPEYIKAQARERILMVMPGERRYLVKGENGVEEAEQQAAAEGSADLQWVDSLWDSVLRSATSD